MQNPLVGSSSLFVTLLANVKRINLSTNAAFTLGRSKVRQGAIRNRMDMNAGDKPTERRMGPAGWDNWHTMLDGAEYIWRERSYACLTSRAVAERIGGKQRLVYYYFRTMEELIEETFLRLASRELMWLRAACQSDRPMHDIWDICTHSTDTRLITEFIGLANRLPPLKVHLITYIEDARRLQIEAVTAAMIRSGTTTHLTADSLVLLATGAALLLARESQLGVSIGHEQLESAITDLLVRIEPA